ncbi:23S rRNA (pseudouridine(1915)-N(3))-methyltransferase RlmH, partial [Campylobacter jejuni]|nr:23S rRNA (pseudouridine(1915)-N(3))-methyltransferase RlmH [Campylobacter jejuni]
MQVNIFCIQKSDEFKTWSEKYSKFISYATLKEINVFNKKIALAQNLNAIEAKKSYEEAF